MTDVLRAHFADGDVLELVPYMYQAGVDSQWPDHPCACGGRVIVGRMADDEGKRIAETGAAILMHTAPVCEPFDRLDFGRAWVYVQTGRIPAEPPPILAVETKPEKPKRAVHR